MSSDRCPHQEQNELGVSTGLVEIEVTLAQTEKETDSHYCKKILTLQNTTKEKSCEEESGKEREKSRSARKSVNFERMWVCVW